MNREEILQAYREYERGLTIANFKVACVLGMLLMPAGAALDYFVYPEFLGGFIRLRLVCSALIGLFLGLLLTRLGHHWYRLLGLILLMLPASSIALMIARVPNSASSAYYAGLNLVLLMLGFVLRWTFRESLAAVALTAAVYLAAVFSRGPVAPADQGLFFNNLYFLTLTGLIVVTGNYFLSALRFREFALRFELDRSRRQLEENHQKLLELDQAKSRFFANVSHELRTPLTLLLAPLERLLHDPARAPDPAARELLLNMQANGLRLLRLINDLLELVRLDAGALQSKQEPVALGDVLRSLLSAVRPMAEDKRINLELTVAAGLGPVLLDRDRLEKTVLNLLFNALKFTPADGRVSLRAQREAQELVLDVADTGGGIAEKDLDRVFDRFWQADDSARRRYRGLGLGLALVKELTEAQGGTVGVRSAPGQGAVFTLRLPYRPATGVPAGSEGAPALVAGAAASTAAMTPTPLNDEWLAELYRRAELQQPSTSPLETPRADPHPPDRHQPTALIADDEPDMLRFLTAQLQEHYQVLQAADGQEAIDRATEWVPDVILLDMMMPGRDGLQVCRTLREQATTRDIPILMLTARADEETKLAALSGGANDFLTKPFSTTELHVRVKHLADNYRLQRALAERNQRLESTVRQLREAEVQLIQAEKIASLGRMSAGIIHEINNPLNFAATGLYALRKHTSQLPEPQQAAQAEVLRDVEEGLERVKAIVSDLRAFTHPDTEHREWVLVSALVDEALKFLSNEWRDRVRVERQLPDTLTVWTNRSRLLQVLLNLFQNALDALRRKTFTRPDEPTLWVEGRTDERRTVLVVRDNGDGIEAAHLDHIFEPFFTTKDVGQGMGLGLSICYRIVQDHQGQLRVRSERGRFAEFTVELPVPPAPAGSPAP